MDPLSAALIVKSLDGLSVRSAVTAENIANSQTRGYRPLQVTFEQALQSAARSGAGAVRNVKPDVRPVVLAPGDTGVRLDQELATSQATALRYGALVDVLSRRLQLDSAAVTGGR